MLIITIATNINIAIPKGCCTEFQYNLAIYILPAIRNEQNKGGQKVSKYFRQGALVIFLDNGYQITNIPAILKITPIAAPEIPINTIKG